MKYFEVVAKCGHVGRMYYYEGHFFVSGDSKKTAAGKVKTFPRVKKDHEDVILWVEEVTEVQYKEGLAQMESNPYFQCGSKHEQNAIVELIQDQIFPETEIRGGKAGAGSAGRDAHCLRRDWYERKTAAVWV